MASDSTRKSNAVGCTPIANAIANATTNANATENTPSRGRSNAQVLLIVLFALGLLQTYHNMITAFAVGNGSEQQQQQQRDACVTMPMPMTMPANPLQNTKAARKAAPETETETKITTKQNPAEQAWGVAMQQAEEMLASTTSYDDHWKAACLIPNTVKTEELVLKRKLVRQRATEQKAKAKAPEPGGAKAFEDPLVPLPVLNMGMPKLGSTTLYGYFQCKGFNATHWSQNTATGGFEGLCMRDAVRVGMPPLATCAEGKHAIMQMDVAFPMGSTNEAFEAHIMRAKFRSSAYQDECFYPQLSILEELHAESPHATLILPFRPMQDWIKSILGWYSMLERFQKCHLPNLPRGQPDLTQTERNHEALEGSMTQFFCSHVLHLRNFVEAHPTLTLIELDLYDDRTPLLMDELFPSLDNDSDGGSGGGDGDGDDAKESCWTHTNKSGNTTSNGGIKQQQTNGKRRRGAKQDKKHR